MSKVSKLLRTPHLFVRDAIANTRVRWEVRRHLAASGNGSPFSSRRSEQASLPETLFRTLSKTTDVFTTPGVGGTDRYNCLSTDIAWVVYTGLLLAEAAGCRLRVAARKKVEEVERERVVSLLARLQSASEVELRFFWTDGHEQVVQWAVWERREWERSYFCRGHNPWVKKVPIDVLDRLRDGPSRRIDLRRLYDRPVDSECTFDVDVVYTWVDHTDPAWRAAISRFRAKDEIDWDRFRSADELRYSLRSLDLYAPWVRNVYILTNCRPPGWLSSHPRIRWVGHEEVFPSADYLPTFSSHAIESCLMRIADLSEHFVYFNDDVFLGTAAEKTDFFLGNGTSISYLEPYAMVQGEVESTKPDYLNAAINGRKLVESAFGVSPTQLHLHTPHALKKSVLLEMEARFPEDFERVRRSRFRTPRDISVVSFLYHHYAFQTRHAVRGSTSSALLVRASNSAEAFVEMLAGRRRRFFCVNDGGDSAMDHDFHARTQQFLSAYYPHPAPWEA